MAVNGVNDALDKAIKHRRHVVGYLLRGNPLLTVKQITAMLGASGLRNPVTGRPWSLGTIHKDFLSIGRNGTDASE